MGILFNNIQEKSRRVMALLMGVLAVFPLSGCDPTNPKKPYNFPGSIWICEEAKACVAVIDQENFGYSYGEVQTDAGIIPVTIIYSRANRGRFRDFYEANSLDTIYSKKTGPVEYLWKGTIEYHTNRFILKEAERPNDGGVYTLFPDEDLPLTFWRYDLPEEELLELVPWDAEANLKEGFEPGKLWELAQKTLEEHPPKKKIVWFDFDLSDFWPDPFGVSDKKESAPESDAS